MQPESQSSSSVDDAEANATRQYNDSGSPDAQKDTGTGEPPMHMTDESPKLRSTLLPCTRLD